MYYPTNVARSSFSPRSKKLWHRPSIHPSTISISGMLLSSLRLALARSALLGHVSRSISMLLPSSIASASTPAKVDTIRPRSKPGSGGENLDWFGFGGWDGDGHGLISSIRLLPETAAVSLKTLSTILSNNARLPSRGGTFVGRKVLSMFRRPSQCIQGLNNSLG